MSISNPDSFPPILSWYSQCISLPHFMFLLAVVVCLFALFLPPESNSAWVCGHPLRMKTYQSSHCQKKKVILPSPEATSCQWSSARVGALGATCSNFKLFLDVLKLKCNYVVSLLPIFFCNPSIFPLLHSLKFMA